MDQFKRKLIALGALELSKQSELLAYEGVGIFQPTATTSYLIKAVSAEALQNKKVLDLGCGWGIIGLELFLRFNKQISLYLSDLSNSAIEATKKNVASLYALGLEVRHGSLFIPWENMKFDCIICDVSGVSNEIPFLDTWFEDIPCESGSDGLDLTKEVIEKAKGHLNPGGFMFLPLISLSNCKSALKILKENNLQHTVISENKWKMIIKNSKHQEILHNLQTQDKVAFIRNGDEFIFSTSIIKAWS
jgi:methylase of polypeptide subunit release factors